MDTSASSVVSLRALDASPWRRGPVGDARGRIAGRKARVLPAILLALAVQFAGLLGAPQAESAAGSAADAMDAVMRAWMAKHAISRGSLAVMRDGRLVSATGYGGRKPDERIPVWSLTKAVTAACVATLVQEARFRFDDPIGPLLAPLFRRFGQPADPRLMAVSVAQLLTHRSGLPERVGNNRFAPGATELLQRLPLTEARIDMLLGAILKVGLVAQPGSTYAYSNVGYLILGQVIEAVAGEPYETACARRVLNPAGIEQARLDDKWGRLLHSTSGWALSGPEVLAFVRFLSLSRNKILSPQSHAWLRSPEGRWVSERPKNAYTLGVRLQPAGNAGFDILHTGGWLWHGKYSERSGVYFVLRSDDVAWFASYDGVTGSSDAAVIAELHDALRQAARSASSWPSHDLFGSMGIRPTTERRR